MTTRSCSCQHRGGDLLSRTRDLRSDPKFDLGSGPEPRDLDRRSVAAEPTRVPSLAVSPKRQPRLNRPRYLSERTSRIEGLIGRLEPLRPRRRRSPRTCDARWTLALAL